MSTLDVSNPMSMSCISRQRPDIDHVRLWSERGGLRATERRVHSVEHVGSGRAAAGQAVHVNDGATARLGHV